MQKLTIHSFIGYLLVQVHPDKTLAAKLHHDQPEIYKDPNHKPEMAIALTKFEALCGFRPIAEIRNNLRDYFELRCIIGLTGKIH